MKKPIILLCLFLFAALKLHAQSCSILSDSVVCLNDFISFQAQVSGGPIASYKWDLGDGQSSTQSNPFVKYTKAGMKSIQVTLTFTNGSTCVAKATVQAHPLPVASMMVDPVSNYCLSKNSVCIDDFSSPGATGSPIVKRVILWGDGDADISFNPGSAKKVCHTFNRDGQYTINLEVTDSKGCINRSSVSVTIYKDVRALFGYNLYGNCDTAALCMFNLTQTDSTKVKWYWDFGNGKKDSVHWSGACFNYYDSGSFSPKLIIRSNNGCLDSFQQNGLINLDPVHFDVVKDKYDDCVGSTWTFEDKGEPKEQYYWYFRDSTNQIALPLGQGNPFSASGFDPGKKYITVTVHRGNCISTFVKDSILVHGPVAKVNIKNKSICMKGDTTYFCDESNYAATVGIKRFWDFGDKYCPACTTNTAAGINVGLNCRFSVDVSPKHLYLVDTCYGPKITLTDTVTGCSWEETYGVQVGDIKPETITLQYFIDKACTGNAVDRTFSFAMQGNCYNFQINPDSAAAPTFFPGLTTWNYPALSQPSGFVTVGLVLESGPVSPSTCLGYTLGSVCRDTLWYHNYIHIINEPSPGFSLQSNHGCAPFKAQVSLTDTSDTTLVMAVWTWGDGSIDTIHVISGNLIQQQFQHTYLKNGKYSVKLELINNRGCSKVAFEDLSVGHNNVFTFKKEPCINDCIVFNDSTLYYGDTTYYWCDTARLQSGTKEKMWWTFSDGDFFTQSHPIKCFRDTGYYTLQLVTLDSSGCYDTSYASLDIGGILSGVRGKDKILCSEIVQFFDSSVNINSNSNEGITGWYWDFGDGSTPSYLQNPYHFYSAFGEFDVRLVIQTSRNCIDTFVKKVFVDGPLPAFEFVEDSIGCVPFEVELKNVSSRVNNWIWYLGDSANTTLPTRADSNIRFLYSKPGTYYIQLYGADSIYNPATQNNQFCSYIYPDTLLPKQIARKVIVLPIEPVSFTCPDTVCRNLPFQIEHTGSPKYSSFLWVYDHGLDTLLSSAPKVKYSIGDTGWHHLDYYPSYIPGAMDRACYDSAKKNVFVVSIASEFDFDPRSTPLEKYFDNLSKGADYYSWNFGQPNSGARNRSNQFEPSHQYFPDKGDFTICLIAANKFGCIDTFCKDINLDYKTHITIPNVFTPGSADGTNDVFEIDIEGEVDYHLRIYNRWGELVFESDQDGEGKDGNNWDGTLSGGREAPAGVYYVIFDYGFYYAAPVRYKGTLTLIR